MYLPSKQYFRTFTLINGFLMSFVMCCLPAYLLYSFAKAGKTSIIFIGVHNEPIEITGERFLSLGLDTSNVYDGLENLKLDSSKLIDLTTRLSPAYLRFGGTMADRLIFQDENSKAIFLSKQTTKNCEDDACLEKDLPFFNMSGSEFLTIANFCKKTNIRLIFDLNALLRNGEDWNPNNAIALIQFAKKHNLDLDWQLGNEPNSFLHVFNVSLTPEQLGKDFKELKNLLKKFYPQSLLVGPDTTRPQPKRPECVKYMKQFLAVAADDIDAMAWHQYYLNGRTATLDDFWDSDTLDLLQFQINTMVYHTRRYRHLDMWLSETSSAYGGGAPKLSNSFAAIPLWLDKLGIAAKNGIQVVARQSLLGGNYSLIDEDHNPLPDYWVSFLFKTLVGDKVVDCSLRWPSMYQRVYCHCAKDVATTNIVIYAMNLNNDGRYIKIVGSALFGALKLDEYILTAPNGDRMSRQILLNDVLLEYQENFPEIVPKVKTMREDLWMPPYSFAFWKIYNTSLTYCSYDDNTY